MIAGCAIKGKVAAASFGATDLVEPGIVRAWRENDVLSVAAG